MKLQDKLMNRIIEGKSDLEEVVSKNGTNVEIGGNLEVDGTLRVNGGLAGTIYIDVYNKNNLDNIFMTLELIVLNSGGGSSNNYIVKNTTHDYCGILISLDNTLRNLMIYYEFGEDNYIYSYYISYNVVNKKYIVENDFQMSLDESEYLSVLSKLYRHDIVGKISDTESVSFTWLVSQNHSSNYNTPIDSLTDLVNLVLVGKYTASGTINGKQVIQVIKTSNATNGLKCLCVDGTEVAFNPTSVTDYVELLQ